MGDDRDRLLGEIWSAIRALGPENVRNFPAAARAIADGAAPEDMVLAMTAAAYEAVFSALHLLTGGGDIGVLAESGTVDGLHEDLLSSDPTGREGVDLVEQEPRRHDPEGAGPTSPDERPR